MALNPPVSNEGVPFRLQDEFVLIERKGMSIEVKVPNMSKLSGKGKIYLTTARMIFVNKDYKNDKFKSIDMPIAMMGKVDFKQPVFGSNYLKYTCKPLFNLLPGVAEIKLWFTEGGCDKFLRIFEHVTKQVYEQKKAHKMNNNLLNQWNNGYFNNNAFSDPSDPTMIFTEQPPVFTPDQQYIGNNIFINPEVSYPTMDGGDQNKNNNQQNFNQNGDTQMNQPNYNNYPGFNPNNQQYDNPPNFNMNQQYNIPTGLNMPPQNDMPNGFNMNQPQNIPHNFHINQPPQYNMPQGFNMNTPNHNPPQGFDLQQPQYNPQQGFNLNNPQQNTPQGFNLNNQQQNTPQGFNVNNQHPPQGFNPNNQQMNMQNLPQMNNPQGAMNQNQNPNAAYYFGFFGPQLKKND